MIQPATRGSFDWALLAAMAALIGLGLLMLYSSTAFENREPFHKQVFWAMISALVLLVATWVPYHVWGSLSVPIYAGCLLLLGLVLVIGPEIRNTRSWLRVGGVSFQPAEVAKVATLLLLAVFLSEKNELALRLRTVVVMVLIVALPVGLILLQPDLGSALVFFPLLAVMVFLAGLRWRVIVLLVVAGLLSVPLLWPQLKPYQQERVLTFFRPERDPQGTGWQVMQSRIAVGSGGFTGKGIGSGSQAQLEFLPDRHTDFIFSVLAEETGFVGASIALTLYGVLLYSCVQTARAARDRLGLFLAMGVATLLGAQIIINIGVILGLMPTAGIPLPLMSYGGSSLVSTVAALGLVLNVRMRCLVN
ncbi:MAG TPA: rod shape-determining protein RodA [Candidatus Saccharimonadales bacterium]|nr:rod shape-determining protein RodA [Candidatus Saccharimonadales bacterium]